MERIRKSYADFYAERFDDTAEFVEALKRRAGEEEKNYRGSDLLNWSGVASWEEVYADILHTHADSGKWTAAKLNNYLTMLKEVCEEIETETGKKGSAKPDAKKETKRRPKPRELEFLFMLDDVDKAKDRRALAGIEERRLAQLAGIALLERDYGYRCSISLGYAYFFGEPRENQTNAACLVKLKKADEPFDVNKLSFLALKPHSICAAFDRWKYTLSHEDGLNEEYARYGKEDCQYEPSYENWKFERKIGFLDSVKEPQSGLVPLEFGAKIEEVLERLLTPISVGEETVSASFSPKFAALETLEDGEILAHVRTGPFWEGDWVAARYDPDMNVTRKAKGDVLILEGNQLMDVLKEEEMERLSYD